MDQLVLYILMRTDLASMNPGKAVAQGCHAANQFVAEWVLGGSLVDPDAQLWQNQTPSGFGTTIVLGVDDKEMRQTVEIARALGFKANIVRDPTYPLVDGAYTHLIPLDSCAYVFGTKAALKAVVGGLKLMA